jgi:putative ABC transport system permease protein
MSTLLQDVKFGLRMLAKNPGFTAMAVLTLALGIGVNAVVFSAVNMVLLRPLPYLHPEQLVMLFASNPTLGVQDMMVPASTFMEWRDNARSFAGMGAFSSEARNLSRTDTTERVQVTEVTANLLPLLLTFA